MQRNKTKLILKTSIITFVFIIFITLINWLFQHGKIQISLPENVTSVSLLSDSRVEVYNIKNSKNFSKIVKKGHYTVLVKSTLAENEFVGAVDVSGFLETSSLKISFSPQKQRSFIGDNPRECSRFISDKLISYPCRGQFIDTVIHSSANQDSPTQTHNIYEEIQKNNDFSDFTETGSIEAVIENDNSLLVLSRASTGGIGEHNLFKVNIINNNISVDLTKSIDRLSERVGLSSIVNDGNILLYNLQRGVFYTGSSFDTLTETIPNIRPNKGYSVDGLDYNKNKHFLVTMKRNAKNERFVSSPDDKSILEIIDDNPKQTTLNFNVDKARFCGQYICVLGVNKNFYIYDYSFNEMLFLSNVADFKPTDESVFVVGNEGILNINTDSLSGNSVYSFGNYKYNGLSIDDNNIIVSVSYKNKKSALLLSSEPVSEYKIDKIIQPLQDNPYIKAVSVYKNYIFISPELGELEYNPTKGFLDYKPEATTEAKNAIFPLIKSLKLEENGYKVTVVI